MTEILKIRAKTRQPKTKITGEKDGIIHLTVHAPPEGNKANIEIIKFFTKRTKRNVRIISGKTSKDKVLELS